MTAVTPGFGTPRKRRRASLTPLVDVVFLLLVFFMLAARFGVDRAIPLSAAGEGGGGYAGAPRLVDVTPDQIRLNGQPVALSELGARLAPLMAGPNAAVILRSRDGATLDTVVRVLDRLGAEGYRRLVLAE
jgi:biopolymer transport protein ExbD